MQNQRRTILKAAGALAVTGAAGSRAFAQTGQYNFKVATNVQTTHPIAIRLTEAVEKIKTETDGKVVINVFPNGQLGSDTDMLSQVRSGALEFLTIPGVVIANLVPIASLNSVGFAFPDYPTVWKAMDGKVGDVIRSGITKARLVVLDKIWDNGFRQITSSKVINSPADLVDMKMRVPVSPMLLSVFKTLKTAPTSINFNELYSALQTKVVEGQENPLPIITSAKLYEVQKYCALTSHVWDGYWMVSNKAVFDGIPANLRDIIVKNFDAAAVLQRADSEKLAVSLQQDLAAKGLVFNKPATAPFRAALSEGKFYAEWKQKFGDEAWAQLEAAVGKLG